MRWCGLRRQYSDHGGESPRGCAHFRLNGGALALSTRSTLVGKVAVSIRSSNGMCGRWRRRSPSYSNLRPGAWRLVPCPHNIVRRLAEDFRDTVERRMLGSLPPGALVDGGRELRERAVELAHRAAGEIAHRFADALENIVDHVAVFRQ